MNVQHVNVQHVLRIACMRAREHAQHTTCTHESTVLVHWPFDACHCSSTENAVTLKCSALTATTVTGGPKSYTLTTTVTGVMFSEG